jgi:eukaryotic-like serine/threonine-protein kinase
MANKRFPHASPSATQGDSPEAGPDPGSLNEASLASSGTVDLTEPAAIPLHPPGQEASDATCNDEMEPPAPASPRTFDASLSSGAVDLTEHAVSSQSRSCDVTAGTLNPDDQEPAPSSTSASGGFSLSGSTLDPSEISAVGRCQDGTVDLEGSVPSAPNQGTSDQTAYLAADALPQNSPINPSDQTAYLPNSSGDSGPVDQSGRTGEWTESDGVDPKASQNSATIDLSGPASQAPAAASAQPGARKGQSAWPARTSRGPAVGEPPSPDGAPSIAGYEIVKELGRGAMGVVYKARQLALNRVVALKMVLAGQHAGPKVLMRFQIEAEAVARLQHPNIVQIFEVGEEKGCPFFALEFVQGGTLTDWIGAKGVSPRQAAWVVHKLAQAMDCAHRNGVTHRDLKPDNILVAVSSKNTNGRPPLTACVPKVSDFGLAKRQEDSGQTQAGSIMGTPSYMAPEQAEGRNDLVGPPADIYALGAILYDLLTGQPPFKGKTILDTLQQVKKVEPVSPRRLCPRLPRDLDTICLKCLEKAPNKRYGSAQELAEDLRRFQAGEPILARQTPYWERAVKYCKRRPATAGLVGLTCLTLLGLLVGGYVYAGVERRRAEVMDGLRKDAEEQKALAVENEKEAVKERKEAEKQRNVADAQRKRAEEQKAFAEKSFGHAQAAVDVMLTRIGNERLEHEPRMEQVRRDVLEEALGFYNRFLEERSDVPQVRYQTARAFKKVGDVRRLLGEAEPAKKAYGSARTLFEELANKEPANLAYRQDLAAVCNNLGNLLNDTGRKAEAEKAYEDALAIQKKLVDESEPGTEARKRIRQELATSCYSLARVKQTLGQTDQALPLLGQALDLQEQLRTEDPRAPIYRQDMARTLDAQGQVFLQKGQAAEAEKSLRRSLALLDELTSGGKGTPVDRQAQALAHDRLGSVLEGGSSQKAEPEYRQAVDLGEKLTADFPTIPVYRQELAASYNNLGLSLLPQGKRGEADKAFQKGLAIKEKLAGDFPRMPDFRRDLANSHISHGAALLTDNRVLESEAAYRRAADLLAGLVSEIPTVPDYQHLWGQALVNQASALQLANKAKEAEKIYREVLVRRKELAERFAKVPAYQFEWARTEVMLAGLRVGMAEPPQPRLQEAENLYRSAAAKYKALADAFPREPDYGYGLVECLMNLGELLKATNRIDLALSAWEDGSKVAEALTREYPNRPVYAAEKARLLHNIGVMLGVQMKLQEAEKSHREAILVREKLVLDHPKEPSLRIDLASSHGELAIVLAKGNRLMPSLDSFRKAVAVLKEGGPEMVDRRDFLEEELVQQTNMGLLLPVIAPGNEVKKCQDRIKAIKEKLAKK